MNLNILNAISPIDGRYFGKTEELCPYFSESGLIKYRVRVEIEYFISLCNLPLKQLEGCDKKIFDKLRELYSDFSETNAERVKEIENTTNHDIKAIEYYIKEEFDRLGISQYKEFVHFGLTSQDINNTAIPLSIKEAISNIYLPLLGALVEQLKDASLKWKDITMLARTHGQPASPTKLGKEIEVFTERIAKQLDLLSAIPFSAKFGGATGNFNAHKIGYPEVDWNGFANEFVNNTLGLNRSYPTTQIEHYDNLAALCDNLKRINNILIDFCRDIWTYISLRYFKQEINKDEVGSSAMPHKVNPIDFENAEGNLGVANAVFEHLSNKLPISRLQRDLTDSTVLRNIGVPIAHTIVSMKSIQKGLNKLIVNQEAINNDLENNWSVISEAIQTILRREGYDQPYEALKELTRTNGHITKDSIWQFIDLLEVSAEIKKELKEITPQNYTGYN